MKLFTLVIDDKGKIGLSGDLSLQDARAIIDAIIHEQSIQQGRQSERQRIRKGFKALHGKGLIVKYVPQNRHSPPNGENSSVQGQKGGSL